VPDGGCGSPFVGRCSAAGSDARCTCTSPVVRWVHQILFSLSKSGTRPCSFSNEPSRSVSRFCGLRPAPAPDGMDPRLCLSLLLLHLHCDMCMRAPPPPPPSPPQRSRICHDGAPHFQRWQRGNPLTACGLVLVQKMMACLPLRETYMRVKAHKVKETC